MSSHIYLYAALILVAACEPKDPPNSRVRQTALQETTMPSADVKSYSLCGKTTTKRRVEEYFNNVVSFLERQNDRRMLSSLVSENIAIIGNDGAKIIAASSFSQAEPYLISIDDWAEIARRGEPRLISAGWRGCILGKGKAAFVVDDDGRLHLSSFNLSLAWD
ncbi:hypothetical protein [Brevundimonas sp.]|uniref:hypothetical protein n=1 Tax=Brevundimonas sp. TaxID=1871086 RepID=UPI002FD956E3